MDRINEMDAQKPEEEKKVKKELLPMLFDTLEIVCLSVVLVILVFTFVGRMATVVGDSMEPTLQNGDRVLVSSFFYTPECGDVVVVQKESGYYDDQLLIKRVIAVGGDWIEIDTDGAIYLNGEKLDEPYVQQFALGECDLEFPYQVPVAQYFVVGDMRESSIDSRNSLIGCIPKDQIVGKVFFRIWPFKDIKFF